jgi:hypothetical protein
MRRTVALLLALPALVACGAPPPPTAALECDSPQLTDLGYVRIDSPAWFTTSGGRVRFSVLDNDGGAVFDDLTSDRRTVSVGDALTLPERATPEGSEIANALDQVDVDPEHPGTLDLSAGSYWVAAYNAGITMASCPSTGISDVVPGVGTVATSTPSPS